MGFFGNVKTPGFGLTNIDEYHIPAILALATGRTTDRTSEWLGQDFANATSGGLNFLDTFQRLNASGLPELSRIQDFVRGTTGFATREFAGLESLFNRNTSSIVGQARNNRTRTLKPLMGAYGDAEKVLTDFLPRTLRNIDRSTRAASVATGVKSSATGRRSAARQSEEAESVARALADLKIGKGRDISSAENATGNTILNAISGRASGGEALRGNIIQALLGLRGSQADADLGFLQMARGFELQPIQALMAAYGGVPNYSAQPTQDGGIIGNIGDIVGLGTQTLSSLGSVAGAGGFGNIFSGLFKDNRMGLEDQLKLLKQYGAF